MDTRFTDAEFEALVRLPAWLFLLVAAADGTVDAKERETFDRLVIGRSLGMMPTASPLLKDVFQTLVGRGIDETVAACRALGIRGVFDELELAQAALRAELSEAEYEAFTVELLGDGALVAGASGGFLGLFGPKVSQQEADVLGLVFRIFSRPASPERPRRAGRAVVPGSVVSLRYVLRSASGTPVVALGDPVPVEVVVGVGRLLPGVEAALLGRTVGERFRVKVPPDQAFGERHDGGVHRIPTDRFQGQNRPEVGDCFAAEAPGGGQVPVWVLAVEADAVVVDFNHPLAGQVLDLEAEIVQTRPASASELAAAREAAGGS